MMTTDKEYDAWLVRKSDGAVRIVRKEYPDDVVNFMWLEGNDACDCNRASYFGDEAECGDDKYRVLMIAEADSKLPIFGPNPPKEYSPGDINWRMETFQNKGYPPMWKLVCDD